nr:YetF domain-containing protein [Pelotomaculum isophthalicicum]
MPQVLVVDGNIAKHRLSELGLSDEWLKQELNKIGINDISEVTIAQLNTTGKLYVDKRSDWDGWQ